MRGMKAPCPALRATVLATALLSVWLALPGGQIYAQNGKQPAQALRSQLSNSEQTAAPSGQQTRRVVVIEDAGSRIEEQRMGGQTERISVQPKNNAPAYEVLPENPSRNPGAQGPARRGGGERVWNIFSF
jgi:hypothetical protein